jgi:hypothetical protein
MEVICLEDKAFYQLIETVIERLQEQKSVGQDKWVGTDDCMRLLNIKSKTTLQQLRDNGEIRFSQPQKKIILYDRVSIDAYLEKHAKNTF